MAKKAKKPTTKSPKKPAGKATPKPIVKPAVPETVVETPVTVEAAALENAPAVEVTTAPPVTEEVEAETIDANPVYEEDLTIPPEAKPAAEPPSQLASIQSQLTSPNPFLRRKWAKRLLVVGALLLILAVGLRVYIHMHPDAAAQKKALISEVSARAVLPTGESPTITTVVDKNQISQSFLQNAANGDKVLLYFQAGKAIVYRPSTHQIVNIGPLSQPSAKVFLRNGTADKILPPSIGQKLGQTSGYTIVSQDASAKHNYAKTLVVDLNGNRPDLALRIAKQIGAQVSQLPAGESAPDADFLIIVGADAQ